MAETQHEAEIKTGNTLVDLLAALAKVYGVPFILVCVICYYFYRRSNAQDIQAAADTKELKVEVKQQRLDNAALNKQVVELTTKLNDCENRHH